MSILVVDDSDFLRKMAVNCLKNIGVSDIIQAEDGEEALEILEEQWQDIEIVWLDWNMPGKDGGEVLQEIRERNEWEDIKVIMVTTKSQRALILEALGNGADDFVVKPFDMTLIKKKFGKFINK